MARAHLVVALACCVASARAAADAPTDDARARQLAAFLGIEPQIDGSVRATPPSTIEGAIAGLDATERAIIELSRASLDLDATVARLQHEEFEAKNAHDLIVEHHDDAVARWNIAAVLVGNGITIVGSGMQFGNDTVAKWGDGVIIAGAALAAAFGVVALVRREAGPLPTPIETNLLAPLLGRTPTERSGYPPWIWRALDTPLAGAPASIRRELVEKWTRERRLPRGDAAASDRRLRLLCEPLRTARRIDADSLDDRADMLADVRERIAGLSVDLDLLWRRVHERR